MNFICNTTLYLLNTLDQDLTNGFFLANKLIVFSRAIELQTYWRKSCYRYCAVRRR